MLREPSDGGGEDWSAYCAKSGHDADDLFVVHLAHLVRSAPSLRELSAIDIGMQAWRPDPDTAWTICSMDDGGNR